MTRTELLAILAGLLICGATVARPVLEIPDNRFEFGAVPQGATVAHYFWFKSSGSDTVVIDHIKTGCSCALMPLERNVMPPGDSMLVGLFWDVQMRIDQTGKYPYIFTNTSPDPLRVFLTAKVVKYPDSLRPVALKPYRIEMPKYADESIDSVSFVMKNYSDKKVTLTQVSLPVKQCEVNLPESLEANSERKGYVKLRPEYTTEEFVNSVTIELDDSQRTRFTLPIRRRVIK